MVIKENTTSWLAVALAAVLIAGGASGSSAGVSASLDRKQIALGERMQLQIRSQGSQMGAEPDLSPLSVDFYVLGQSQSTRTTIVNGRRDASINWLIELTPLKTGNLQIPSLSVGTALTQPIQISVTAAPTPSEVGSNRSDDETAAPPRGIELIAQVDRAEPYVQEQVGLTLRLESGVPIVNGSLSEPEIPGAIVEKLGEDHSEVIEVDGQPLYVFERRYALFPQQSGELLIHPSIFDGTVRTEQSRSRRDSRGFDSIFDSRMDALLGGSIFDNFFGGSNSLFDRALGRRGQSVRVLSDPVQLLVQERPEEALGERWLPAQNLELVEIWGDGKSNPPTMTVGQPVDRVVAVRARGVTASQLPIPEISQVDGLKQYTEPAYEDSQEAGPGLVAVRALPTVLIPTRAGSITLPAVEVEWWDTETDRAQTASLPARTVEVLASTSEDQQATQALPPLALDGGSQPGPPSGAPVEPQIESGDSNTVWIGLGLCVAVGGIGLLWMRGRKTRAPSQTGSLLSHNALRRTHEKALRKACLRSDPVQAEAAVLALGRWRWPDAPPRTTSALSNRLETPLLQQALHTLSAHRFAQTGNAPWDGADLWHAYRESGFGRRQNASPTSAAVRNVLPELYPTT